MAVSKMTLPVALMGAFTSTFTLTNTQSTESIAPEQLGSTSINGAMVYSMNYCSIIHETSCRVSLSTDTTTSSTDTSNGPPSTAYESVPYPLPTASEPTTPGEGALSTTTSGQATTSASQTSEGHLHSSSDIDHPTSSETAPSPGATSAAGAVVSNVAQAAVMSAVVAGFAILWFF